MKKRRKITAIILTMVLVFVTATSAFASETCVKQNGTEKVCYSDETIVTAENVLYILDDLGIEHGKLVGTDNAKIDEYTVADLKQALFGVSE